MANIINTQTGTTVSTSTISVSNQQILNSLVNQFSNLLNLSNYTLDQSESSFLSYIINQISILLSDSLFYVTSIANESTLVTAQLPTSIYNWASYLGYTPQLAVPATTSVQLSITYNTPFVATIPAGTAFYAGNITFTTDYQIQLSITNNISLYYVDSNGIEYPLLYNVVQTPNTSGLVNTNTPYSTITFNIPVTQQYVIQEQFTVSNLNQLQSYSYTTTLPSGLYPVSTLVQTTDSNGNVINWTAGIIVSSTSTDYVYQVTITNNQLTIEFGNGIQGVQPSGLVNLYITVTNGANGNVLANTINTGQPLYGNIGTGFPPLPLTYSVTNPTAATGGTNAEDLNSIRTNAPLSLSMLNRIVTEQDYTNILQVLGATNTSISSFILPILKRSDLTTNDVYLYTIPMYGNQILKSDSIAYDITDIYGTTTSEIIPTQVLTAYNPLSDIGSNNTNTWSNLFLLKLNYTSNYADYYYLPVELIPPYQVQYMSSTSHSNLSQIVLTYNMYSNGQDTYQLQIYVWVTDANLSYSQSISILQNQQYITYTNTNCNQTAPNQIIFTYTIPRSQLENISNVIINTFEAPNAITQPTLANTYYTNFDIETPLNQIAYSYIINYNNRYYLLDIPVIDYNTFQSISNQSDFISNLVGQFMANANSVSNSMMNTQIAVKFARTYGYLVNNLYSTPDFYASGILYGSTNLPTNPQIGSYYAVSDPISLTDPWYPYGGALAIWTGQTWSFTKVGTGTTIRNIQ
ncbi:MAG: hypothetical protein QW478_10450, partial [Candidatus Micrarchaeaceae archaeon]